MGNHKKKQEGVFIALFALSTLVVIGLAIGFMSNTVNNLLAGQGQVMAGKQSYWLAYSGMEITSTNRFAGITAGTNTYTLEGGTITTIGANVGAGKFNGSDITDEITSTGTIADGSRQLKWTLGNPSPAEYALFLKNSNSNKNTDWVEIDGIQSEMEMNGVCDQSKAEHTTYTLCNAGAADHEPPGAGHFNITYTVGSEAADYTVSFWVRSDFTTMQATSGAGNSATRCWLFGVTEADGVDKTQGIQIGIRTENGSADEGYLEFRYDNEKNVNAHFSENGSATQMTSNNWYHVAYYRTVSDYYGYAYLNGVYQGKYVDPSSFEADDIWRLGTDMDNPGPTQSENFGGLLDEVAVWKTALSKAQIQSLYIQGKSFDIAVNMGTNLVAYWNFDNNSNDQSSPAYHSTITGAAYTGF